jgi:predicted acetyltransferase
MQIDLVRASSEDATTLSNLFQYYVYDMSEFVDLDVVEQGRFAERSFEPYWTDPRRHPQFVRVDGKLAGFVLVHQKSRITGDENTWDLDQFFVMRKYRRRGVGQSVATRVFEMFRGPWEVREVHSNLPAIAFWRRVIGNFTAGNFKETLFDDERWRGPVQSFQS